MRTTGNSPIGVRIAASAICVVLFATLSCVFPSKALAWFNDTANSFPATQDLGTFDDPIVGSQLPDGTYKVTARTTSSMCIMYTNPANAEARDSKEQAIISVDSGRITAVFYISRAYNYLYMGTQEEAAAATNADGTDASNYMAGDPPEGYVAHLFYMDVPALNVPITFSSYSGGNNGTENGVWYTRQVVFGMSMAEYEQIITDWRQQQEPEQEPQPEPESEPDQQPEESSNAQDQQAVLEPENVNASNGNQGDAQNGGSAQTADDQANTQEQGSGQTAGQTVPQTGGMRGVKMNIVSPNELTLDIEVEPDSVQRSDEELALGLSPRQIIALVVVGLLIAGVLARVLVFHAGYERVDGPPSAPLSRAGGKKWKGPGSGSV